MTEEKKIKKADKMSYEWVTEEPIEKADKKEL